MNRKHFRSTENKGFQIKFSNGVVLSTQFGYANYCENYNQAPDFEMKRPFWESDNCEVAIFNENEDWITKEFTGDKDGGNVIGHVKFDDWLKVFDWCRNYGLLK